MHCKGGNFSKSRRNQEILPKKFDKMMNLFCSERVEILGEMHCKGMDFTDFFYTLERVRF